MNSVKLLGNLTSDPETRFTPKGVAVVEFTLAVTERWKNDAGEQKESTYFGRCVAWGKSGEAFAQYHKKGQKALIEGKLKQDEWEDKETGKKRTATRIQVERWHFITSKSSGRAEGPAAPPQAPAPRQSAPKAPTNSPGAEPMPPDEDDVPF
jgi:single-strand DNA-binding protein